MKHEVDRVLESLCSTPLEVCLLRSLREEVRAYNRLLNKCMTIEQLVRDKSGEEIKNKKEEQNMLYDRIDTLRFETEPLLTMLEQRSSCEDPDRLYVELADIRLVYDRVDDQGVVCAGWYRP